MEKEIITISFFNKEDKSLIAACEANINDSLLSVMREKNIAVNAVCGGAGTCGKCKVYIDGKEVLACSVICKNDIDVYIDKKNEMKMLLETEEKHLDFSPIIEKRHLKIEEATLTNSFDDESALRKSMNNENLFIPLSILKKLPSVIRKNNYKVSVIYDKINNTLIDIEEQNDKDIYGAAFDLGTTTSACKLYSLTTGKEIAKHAMLNKQDIYGHDVMSRIHHCYSENGIEELQNLAYQTINEVIDDTAKKSTVDKERIYAFAVTGNSTMLHLFFGISVESLAVLPFTPVFKNIKYFSSEKLSINKNALCYSTPIIGGFVGGDTVSSILASGMYKEKALSMIVDIGTNGESAIGNESFILSSSAPAGPAFEGAEIKCGMRGTEGAIEYASYSKETHDIDIKTIGNAKPIGICGSGLIDIISAMLDSGVLEETGELLTKEEAKNKVHEKTYSRLKEIDGINSFVIADNIYITQKDIRAFQLAKAAIASIMNLLIKEANTEIKYIDKIYIAGAFGNYIRIESALKIGLIPKTEKEKVKFIGNAALTGCALTMLSEKYFADMLAVSEKAKNMEFGGTPTFQMVFADCLMLGSDV